MAKSKKRARQNAAPIKTASPPVADAGLTEEIGGATMTGVRPVMADHPAAGLTPARLAALLRAAEAGDTTAYLELAEDMEERDLHYRGVLTTRKLSVAQLPITVEAAGTDAPSIKAADLVRDWIASFPIEDLCMDLMDGLGKGFSAVELVWTTTGAVGGTTGLWLPERAEHREARWMQIDPYDGKTLRLRDGSALGADLAAHKWLVHRPRVKSGLPIRGGLARAVAWSFLFKSFAIKDWVIFAETYGMPLRLGRYGPEATDKDRRTLLRAVRDLGTDAGAIIPKSMEIEFIKAEGSQTSAKIYEDLCDYLDQQVSKAVLGQTATTDAIAGGHAVGQEHRQVQADIERADARQLAATLNAQLIPPLVGFNLGDVPLPKIIIGRPDQEDVTALVDNIVKLVPLGLSVSMAEVRDKLGLSDPDEGEAVLVPPSTGQNPPVAKGPGFKANAAPIPAQSPARDVSSSDGPARDGPARDVPPRDGPPRDGLDDLTDAMLDDWRPAMAPLVEPLLTAVAAAKTPDDLQAALAGLAARPPDQLAEMLARGAFTARLAGLTGTGETGGDDA